MMWLRSICRFFKRRTIPSFLYDNIIPWSCTSYELSIFCPFSFTSYTISCRNTTNFCNVIDVVFRFPNIIRRALIFHYQHLTIIIYSCRKELPFGYIHLSCNRTC